MNPITKRPHSEADRICTLPPEEMAKYGERRAGRLVLFPSPGSRDREYFINHTSLKTAQGFLDEFRTLCRQPWSKLAHKRHLTDVMLAISGVKGGEQ